MSVEIIFENHSTSADNEHRVASGWLDGCLSDKRKKQAKALGERRLTERIDAIFSSDLARAIETTNIAFGGSGVPVYLDKRLRECYGTLNGAPVTQLEAERSKHIDEPFLEGESYRDVVRRAQDFLNDLSRDWNGKRVVLIGHSATRWALEVLLSGKALTDVVSAPYVWQEGWRYVLP
ncbi:MAG: histidine phosphatase family protein [Chloroflexi bacterium]|nr:histidine phosphatase family protein [Chloroflexota bacterium]